ncbi:MAG: retropepsin-like aspartic protease family protein [Cognatishimia sp.]
MSEFEIGNLAYLSVLGVAVVLWFVSDLRQSFGKTVQQALAWGLIFLGVIAAVGMWEDIRTAARPAHSVFADQGRIEIPVSADGHYYLTAEVNGTEINFVVDTGATDLVLSQEDATRAGLNTDTLRFLGRAMTANGEVRTAIVRLDEVQVGDYTDEDIAARVTQSDMDISLLGMSYLNRYEQITITKGKLVLTR